MGKSNKQERFNKRGKTSVVPGGEVKKKMRPYVGEDENKFGKFVFENTGESVNINKTKKIKTELKNANRSAKKSARQEAKDEINKIIKKL